MTPAERIADLRALIRHHEERYYVLNDSGDLRRRVRRADEVRSRRSSASTRNSSRRTRRPSASAAARSRASTRSSTRCRCSRSTTRTARRSCAAFDERVRRGLADDGGRAGAGGLRRRAEDRRPQHLADLRGRAARARRDAGRRVPRRGRDVERPDHPGDSAGAVAGRCPGGSRSAARCTCRGAAFDRINREREEREEPRVRQSAECGGRHDAEPRSAAGGAARPVGVRLPADRRRRTWCRRRTPRRSRGFASGASRSKPHWQRCQGIDEVLAYCDEWQDERRSLAFDTDGVVVKLDDLALRERARGDVEVPAVGDRVQVPGGAGHDDAAADRRQRRPHGRGDAVRRARAGAAVRVHDPDGDPAQRAGDRPTRHPARRLRAHREGRRGHPEGGRPGALAARSGRSALADADRVPGLRQRAAPARGRGGVAVRRTPPARRDCGGASSTSRRAAR